MRKKPPKTREEIKKKKKLKSMTPDVKYRILQ
jgi:hypothetical protein